MSRYATALEAVMLARCRSCKAEQGEPCHTLLGKPMNAAHWPRIEDATDQLEETP